MDVFDFTPYQYPADEPDSTWYTTHFDFHAIHDNVLKLDILGHDDPTMLRYLGDTTGIDIKNEIPFDDKNIISLFTSPKALGVTEEQILCKLVHLVFLSLVQTLLLICFWRLNQLILQI